MSQERLPGGNHYGQGGFSQVKGRSDPGRRKNIGRDQESGWSRE